MEMFRAVYKPSRDGYDMSYRNRFTANVGEVLPVYSKLVMKGDKWQGNVKFITNTRPLNTDAYTSVREYYNWYFVPMNLLWDKFNHFSVDLRDNVQVASSINGNQPLSDKHPYFTCSQIYDALSKLDNLSESNNKLNIFGFERGKLARKLLHYLDYGDYYKPRSSMIRNADLSPWRLLAYQKIYQDFYRDSQWESARPNLFNLNYMDGRSGGEQIALDEVDYTKWSMFDIRYANWNKDYFMGLLPNSQYGDAATVDLGSMDIGLNLSATKGYILSNGLSAFPTDTGSDVQIFGTNSTDSDLVAYKGTRSGSNITISNLSQPAATAINFSASEMQKFRQSLGITNSNQTVNSAFTILALRQAEALQKYKEIKQSNKQDFPSQAMAQFGVQPSTAYSNRCQWLKGMDSTIDINPVVNTNLADDNAALVRGRGIGAGNGQFSFESDIDGVLMCIYHAVPVLDYAIDGIHPDNTKTLMSDYAQPIFDKTGMQQVDMIHLLNHFPDTAMAMTSNTLLGYGPAYLDYKTDVSRIHGGFYNGDLLTKWVAPLTSEAIARWLEGNQSGDYSVWQGLNSSFFKVDPSIMNPVFTTDASDFIGDDQLWCNAFFNLKAVRSLDRDGLPY